MNPTPTAPQATPQQPVQSLMGNVQVAKTESGATVITEAPKPATVVNQPIPPAVSEQMRQNVDQGKVSTPVPTGMTLQPTVESTIPAMDRQSNAEKVGELMMPNFDRGSHHEHRGDVGITNAAIPVVAQIGGVKVAPFPKNATDDVKKAIIRCAEIRAQALSYGGKKGCNPYLWLTENLNEFEARLVDGDTQPGLIALVNSLQVPERPNTRKKFER
jgi:hypothetical protein